MTVRNQKIAVFGGVGIIILAFILVAVFYKEPFVPSPAFRDAYTNAAKVSEEITGFTKSATDSIKDIEISDTNGDRAKAGQSIELARSANKNAYKKAFELSNYLRALAESLSEIDSQRAKQAAYEAVATELGLVSEFINYTHYMNSFLDGLEQAVTSDAFTDRKAVEQLEREVNKKVAVINKLNNDFQSKMSALLGN